MEFAARLRRALRERIGAERFELWFREVAIVADDRHADIQIFAATAFQLERLRKNFQDSVSATAQYLLKAERNSVSLQFQVLPEDELQTLLTNQTKLDPNGANSASASTTEANGIQECPERERASQEALASNPGKARIAASDSPRNTSVRLRAGSETKRGRKFQTMATFVQGPCNQIAMTSAEMVLQQPGEMSPLVVHGPTGSGKTHLVEAIWSKAKRTSPRARVLYLSAEQYTTYFLEALRGHGLPSFRRKYRQADVLILDDIQFLAGKQATLVEFAYTIDELARNHRQLILTSDRPPAQLSKLGPEIVNRLCGGLVCAMKPVDIETMEQISNQWSQSRGISMPASMHSFLAGHLQGDARQLSGILNRLQATSVATGQRITESLAQEILFELVPSPRRIIRLQDIRKAVCETFNLESDNLQTASRSQSVATPRMLAMWLARRHTAAGLHEISRFFGRRSHSSAVTAQKTIDAWVQKGHNVEINGQRCNVRDLIGQLESSLKTG